MLLYDVDCSEETFEEILKRLYDTVDDDLTKIIVNVDRDDVLDGGFRAFKRKQFNIRTPLHVRFSFETGIDNGGLTREFLRLALKSMATCNKLFYGNDLSNFISMDYKGEL